MPFHSFEFILAAFPLTLLGFIASHRVGGWTTAFQFLAAASLAFYAQFSITLLAILMVSVITNYAAGEFMTKLNANRRLAGVVLFAAIAANLGALGYFKYTNFLFDIANTVFGAGFSHAKLLLPVGVSFYTFIQIGYLIEVYNGQVERQGFSRYVLFATFFPCVTAGPLILQREIFDQMHGRKDDAFDARRISVGMTLFAMGLFKKVVLADSIAPYANPVFDGVTAGQAVEPAVAWIGTLCYTLQLYFDFSGYSDMALGLGCVFGLRLPLNFDSPFKATNISDFWRRWHMTMTRFFTTFIYTPLAMNGMRGALQGRAGRFQRFVAAGAKPALITFMIAGIWHGAGWTFVVYGIIHGVAIATNLAWREFSPFRLPAAIGWFLTMSVVTTALVVFRADDLATAGTILAAMWFGISSPNGILVTLDMRQAVAMVVLLGSIVLLMPNTQQILHRTWVSSDPKPADAEAQAGLLSWRLSFSSAFITAAVGCAAVASIGATSTFLYYKF
jgi:D-alanyl-lipoteichoic acid acyltransferase DltB (MBOAT superfamily)